MNRAKHRVLVAVAVGGLGLAFLGESGLLAHKAVTSPYTYNEHVFPILRDNCGGCHVRGGAAPMSLVSYQDQSGGAFAWAQAIREMLVSQAMPPWYVDATGPAVEHMHTLSAHDLDVVVTWASGGAPEGDPARRPPPMAAHIQWALGKPDLIVSMPAAHTVGVRTLQEDVEVTLPTDLTSPRWVRAADLLPGTPSIVRRAQISVVNGPVLRVWEPGDEVPVTPDGTAFQLPAGAKLRLHLFYKKSWQEEQEQKTDRSSVGLYFTHAPPRGVGIDAETLEGPITAADAPISFNGSMSRSGRVLAVRTQLDRPYESMLITAVTVSGNRIPLLKLHAARPEWPRRYWLRQQVRLEAGTKIEVTGMPDTQDQGPLGTKLNVPLQVAVDFVPQ